MEIILDTKQDLINKLEEKEAQLFRAQRESDSLNKGKYKKSSNAQVSKIYVDSLQKEVDKLRQEIESFQ